MNGEGSVIEREIFIDAPSETVFGFLIEPELMEQWMVGFTGLIHARAAFFRLRSAEETSRAGSTLR